MEIERVKRKKTARMIAERLGIHPRTVRRYIAVPRAEYEAKSITRAKPWETLGMSRATWYRKGKPTSEQLAVLEANHP
jgi:predicted transcriptional regulator